MDYVPVSRDHRCPVVSFLHISEIPGFLDAFFPPRITLLACFVKSFIALPALGVLPTI